jgi:hypothetical protein
MSDHRTEADIVRADFPLSARFFVRNRADAPAIGQGQGVYKLWDDGIMPLICPTCQNVFAGSLKASMPAATGYFAWGCFRYF